MKIKCQCCYQHTADGTVYVDEGCQKQWRRKPNGEKRMLQMVRAQGAVPGTKEHDLALVRMYIEGNYNEYGGDEELEALDRIESRLLKLEAPPVDMSSVMGPRRDGHEFDHASQTAGGYQPEPETELE